MKTQEELMEQNRLARKKFLDVVYRPDFSSTERKYTKPIDDVQYSSVEPLSENQDWWGKMNVVRQWYCKEHKLAEHSDARLRRC